MTHRKNSCIRRHWARKENGEESAESAVDDTGVTGMWAETAVREPTSSAWDGALYDPSYFEDNKRIFEWDDSGAVDSFHKVQSLAHTGWTFRQDEYFREADAYLHAVDDDVRRICSLESCAEDVPKLDEGRGRGDSSESVVLGLPQHKEDDNRYASVAIPLPPNYVPEPTGWGESDETPASSRSGDVQMQLAAPNEAQENSKHELRHPGDEAWGSGRPELPDSYRHIQPTGWGDVPSDSTAVPSGWRNATFTPDVAATGWGDTANDCCMVSESTSESPEPWTDLPFLVEKKRDTFLSSRSRKQHGNWRPKRDNNSYESVGRKGIQKAGKVAGTVYRSAYDSRPCRPRFQRVNFAEQAPAIIP